MEVIPKKYKQTRVGIVPDDWKELPLSTFVKEKSIYCNDDKINFGSLTIKNGVIPKPAQYKREHLVKDSNDAYKLIEGSDFAYNPMNLRFGALALYSNQQQLKVSGYYNIFNVDEDIVNIDYIYAYLKSERIMFYYNRMATGSLEEKKRVHFNEFKKFIFPIPSIQEQRKIAEILSMWDNAILKQNNLITEKEKLKKALNLKLLSGEVKCIEFSDEREEITINELFNFKKGQGISKSKVTEQGINKCILYGELYTTYTEVISNVKSKTNCNEGIKSIKDDILIPSSTTTSAIDLAVASVVKFDNILLGGDINILRKKNNNVDGEFIAKYLTHIKKMEIAKYAQGITIIHLYSKDIKHLKIKIPLIKEQKKIAEVLSNADKEIDLLKNELEELEKQKKGLMQKLLTGEIRVKV